ncbi:MAG: hypothetical protein RLZZ175_3411, partial [Bacteroidota bacterium]
MKFGVIILFNFLSLAIFAQDIQFSQFYTNTIYSNPAFAGSAHQTRLMLHERIQWPGNDAKFITSFASIDGYLAKRNLGIGAYVLNDIQGNGNIRSNEFQGLLSYELATFNNKCIIRFGGQLGIVNRTLDYTKLIFPEQITQDGINSNLSNFENNQSTNFIDMSFGGLVFTNNFWFGYSMHHLNEPNQSFIKDESILPIKQIYILGYKIVNKSKEKTGDLSSFTPTIHYKTQGKSDQVDAGIFYSHSSLMLGLWYRCIPIIKHYKDNPNNESLIFLLGYKFGFINISYSYDSVISELTKASPYGAHE